MDELQVLSLDINHVEDIKLKNKFIESNQSRFLAITYEEFSETNLLQLWDREQLYDYSQVIVFCGGPTQDAVMLDMPRLLECFYIQISAIIFQRDLLYKSGRYNENLNALSDFEFLCRLAMASGKVLFVYPGIAEKELQVSEADTLVYAYLVRKYMTQMKQYGNLEKVLQDMYYVTTQMQVKTQFESYLNQFLSSESFYERLDCATEPFLIFRGDSTCHGVLRDFADSFTECLNQLGYATELVDGTADDYEAMREHAFHGIIGFQAVAMGVEFFKTLRGPKFQFWLDNPVFYSPQIKAMPADCCFLCQDVFYAKYIQNNYSKKAIHFPPGGHLQLLLGEERLYDIIFIGGFSEESKTALSGEMEQYYKYMLEHPLLPFSEGLKNMYLAQGKDTSSLNMKFMSQEWKSVCQRIINHFRKAVIDTILSAGYHLHVYGDSWDKYDSPYAFNLIRHPEVTVEASLKEWQKAKIGLNIMSWHKAGMTERVANIMLAGAACLTESTFYLDSHFSDLEDIVTFRLDQLDELPKKIAYLLEDDRWKQIAQKGFLKAKQEHTWIRRTKEFLDTVIK